MPSTETAVPGLATSDPSPETIRLEALGPATAMDRARLQRASWAFTTRRVSRERAGGVVAPVGEPRVGDLVLARVDALGLHKNLHLVSGRRRHLFVGDEIVVAYGNRYASSQFESVLPRTPGPCHLVAGGGMASRVRTWHARAAQGPTQITPLGLVTDRRGRRVNLADFALPPIALPAAERPATIAVVGTSMDSGKTQTATYLVKGLINAGLRVGYAKVTGTGAGGDVGWLEDAGADPVLDFTDLGLPSTYLAATQVVEHVLGQLVAHVARAGVDATVLEIADGVFQRETAALLRGESFAELVDGIVLAAGDSMGASAGVGWLRGADRPVLALSGLMTAAPLQIAEASAATGLPALNREELATPGIAMGLLGGTVPAVDAPADLRGET